MRRAYETTVPKPRSRDLADLEHQIRVFAWPGPGPRWPGPALGQVGCTIPSMSKLVTRRASANHALTVGIGIGMAIAIATSPAHADERPAASTPPVCTPAAPASTAAHASPSASSSSPSSADESPVARARDLLARARLLDEAALGDEKSAVEIAARLPALRATAKTARDKADRASGEDRETLVSRAEDLEADVAISEAETTAKKRAAVDNRRMARELRARAVRLVREAPVESPANAGSPCDPPYRYTADGRKIYRVECLK